MNRNDYLLACYAAFLGKVIGVRLGAPVENWTAERIEAAYPALAGYPVDYGVFAADDDTNGPLFFVRAAADGPAGKPLMQRVADAILNYVPDHDGFFWWGGYGVSTEQTAYENLQNGVLPPASGSAETNGKTLSEQIGGQIFSDCWGYLHLGDPPRAAADAAEAARVTHDGAGVQGARFIAAAIAAAPGAKSVRSIIETALTCLDEGGDYALMARDILAFFDAHPDDWRDCLLHIRRRYGAETCGGVCHILPNAAVLLLSLCYGGGDFAKTLLLCCRCGMDTDCNCGNVGSVMGAYRGLAGIPETWIRPINDVLLCSGGLGYVNNGSVSGGARMFAAIAAGETPDDSPDWAFDLPYETKGAVAAGGTLRQDGAALRFSIAKPDARVYWTSYYRPGELYDARYEPTLAPLVYPGGTVRFAVSARAPVSLAAYAETDAMGTVRGALTTIEGRAELALSLPAGGGTALRFGICAQNAMGADVLLHAVSFDHRAALSIDFANWLMDDYGERFAGGRHRVVRGFTAYSGDWSLLDGRLEGRMVAGRDALLTTGDAAFTLQKLSMRFSVEERCGCYAAFAVRGGRRYVACGVRDGAIEAFVREDGRERLLLRRPLAQPVTGETDLVCEARGNELAVDIGGETLCAALPEECRDLRGAAGVLLRGAGACRVRALSVRA